MDNVCSSQVYARKALFLDEFQNMEAEVEGDINQLEGLNIHIVVDAASINTNNDDRDGHLRSADFFDVENHPTNTIKSETINKVSDGEYELVALVTMKDVTNKGTFHVEYNGSSTN